MADGDEQQRDTRLLKNTRRRKGGVGVEETGDEEAGRREGSIVDWLLSLTTNSVKHKDDSTGSGVVPCWLENSTNKMMIKVLWFYFSPKVITGNLLNFFPSKIKPHNMLIICKMLLPIRCPFVRNKSGSLGGI